MVNNDSDNKSEFYSALCYNPTRAIYQCSSSLTTLKLNEEPRVVSYDPLHFQGLFSSLLSVCLFKLPVLSLSTLVSVECPPPLSFCVMPFVARPSTPCIYLLIYILSFVCYYQACLYTIPCLFLAYFSYHLSVMVFLVWF